MAQLNVGSVTMGEYDRDHFIVMSKLARGSIRGNIGSVLSYYVRRRWESDYVKILNYVANKAGISPDDCFNRLLAGESVEDIIGQSALEIPAPSEDKEDLD